MKTEFPRVLLVDDFSGVHSNLLNLLNDEKIDNLLITSGDGYKKILYNNSHLNIIDMKNNSIEYFFQILRLSRNYDIIQFLNFYRFSIYINFLIILILKIFNKEVRYYAVGTDPSFLHGGKFLRHFAWHNNKPPKYSFFSKKIYFFLIKCVNIYVPNLSYSIGFEKLGYKTKKLFYPRFPKSLFKKNILFKNRDKVVYVPISREGFKGSNFISKACELIKTDSSLSDVTIKKSTRIEFKKYIENIYDCDFLIDQCLSSDYAMNSILALECGKTVLCGVSDDHLKWKGINPSNCPVVDILPNHNHIYEVLKKVIKNDNFADNDYYLEQFHGKKIILNQFFNK